MSHDWYILKNAWRFGICFSMPFLLGILAGCSVHPLPDDVTRDSTVEIINKIRCEARDAIVDQIMDELNTVDPLTQAIPPQNIRFLHILENSDKSEETFCKLPSISRLHPVTLRRLKRFDASTITYGFMFQGDVTKDKSGSLTFKVPFFKQTDIFQLALKGGARKTRSNLRNLSELQDSFSSLVFGENASGVKTGLKCSDYSRPRKRWIYPITGQVGLDEMIKSYIGLKLRTKSLTAFNDELKFTTTFDANVDQKVVLGRVITNEFNLTEATLKLKGQRKDVHTLTVSFAQPSGSTSSGYDKKLLRLKNVHTIIPKNTKSPLGEDIGLAYSLSTTTSIPSPSPKRCRALTDPPGSKRSAFAISPAQEKSAFRKGRENTRRIFLLDPDQLRRLP